MTIILAAQSGGRVVEPVDLDRLPQWLHAEVQRTRSLTEATLWDNGLVAIVLVLLFCGDVGLRRWHGLA